ncbi:MAG: MBOAT family protein [Bacteroidetes bacterium]|nr:MBOAT family protein [Bacteroidota bacterium]
MLFNSLDFAIFFPIVFILYWFVTNRNLRWQNILLIAASYLFYGWWDWRFLFLLIFSTAVDYSVGLALEKVEHKTQRKILLWASVIINLGFLGFFKYYNFFVDNFVTAFSFFEKDISPNTLNIILPVGISFYTFHGLSYVFDIYFRRIKATRNWVDYSLFVSFFPLLVAGPIERATHLLPQMKVKRKFEYVKAVDGLRQILWGIFKKVVIADNCAEYANMIFNHSSEYSGASLVLGALFFTFQIYGDFSGYSDIALGTARLLGFELLRNFAFPYFSRDIAEFWRRWHISLSSWFRDYLYIPLGGSKGGIGMKIRNTFIIFLVSGFWHGASWTFIAWGALNALYFMPLLLSNNNRNHMDIIARGKFLPTIREAILMLTTFGLTVFAWIFFRAESIGHAFQYVGDMLLGLVHKAGYHQVYDLIMKGGLGLVLLIGAFLLMEWVGREGQYALANVGMKWKRPVRWALYSFILFLIGMFMQTNETPFIYFQF